MSSIQFDSQPATEEVNELARQLHLSPVLATLLYRRGHRDVEAARKWLDADLSQLEDPAQFHDMPKAVQRIRKALYGNERIMIHGDYDVDGLTATVLLLNFFRMIGADVDPYIPSREEGYSIGESSVRRILERKYDVVISVDNGTAAIDEVRSLQEAGVDVIVTDHHHTGPVIAPACAVLNPRLEDSGYPFPHLAGVGVAFKLACAITESLSKDRKLSNELQSFLIDAASLVALGSIADVVPLVGENRAMVRVGLKALLESRSPGMRALVDVLGASARNLRAEDVSFRIGPRLNAAGRMGHAKLAVQLLTADSYGEARKLASRLEKLNSQRQQVEADLFIKARDQLLADPETPNRRVLLAHGEGWHLGVLGIVAARISEDFRKPALILSDQEGRSRGSGRSYGRIDLKSVLDAASAPVTRYGGHAFAVGLEIASARLPELQQLLDQHSQKLPNLGPHLVSVDAEAPLSHWSSSELRQLARFRPFGEGNEPPRFLARDVRIGSGLRRIGPSARGLCFTAIQNGVALRALAPRLGARIEEFVKRPAAWQLVYSPRLAARAEHGAIELLVHAIERVVQEAGEEPPSQGDKA
ncbi:MAG: single-stranded-DNA-specific exonuclease RecJ [Planctomycetota bacterium]|nr:MAG: single-stranded-DNA-specific exonuclease RecJ [Planctomycetota bacterium]